MKIKLNSTMGMPSQDMVAKVAAALNLTLPVGYLQRLAEINGAVPESNIFDVADRNNSGVNQFIPFDRVSYEVGLLEQHGVETFLPIAYAEGGNYVCVATKGLDEGKVFFLDHEIPGLAALTKVAASIEDFFQMLRPFTSEDIKLKPGQVKRAWIDPDLLK